MLAVTTETPTRQPIIPMLKKHKKAEVDKIFHWMKVVFSTEKMERLYMLEMMFFAGMELGQEQSLEQ